MEIDKNWKFHGHIEALIKKIRMTLPMLYSIKNYLGKKSKLALFEAWIMSHIRYGCTIYGFTTTGYVTRLQKILNKALKILFCKFLDICRYL